MRDTASFVLHRILKSFSFCGFLLDDDAHDSQKRPESTLENEETSATIRLQRRQSEHYACAQDPAQASGSRAAAIIHKQPVRGWLAMEKLTVSCEDGRDKVLSLPWTLFNKLRVGRE